MIFLTEGRKKRKTWKNDSGEKKIEFLDDDFELKNLSKAQLDSLCHAISRYHTNANAIPCHANSHKLSVYILGCGVSDEEKMLKK